MACVECALSSTICCATLNPRMRAAMFGRWIWRRVLNDAISSLGAAIEESGAKITHDPLPVLITDSRIEHVLQNLLSNAIKYCRKGVTPEIHVSAKLEGDTWVFSVRDNGIGIEPQYQTSDIPGVPPLAWQRCSGHGRRACVGSEDRRNKCGENVGGVGSQASDPRSTLRFHKPMETPRRTTPRCSIAAP